MNLPLLGSCTSNLHLVTINMVAGDVAPAANGTNGRTVCLTGAGGFNACWLVKLFLEKVYTAKGTLINTDDPKNAHLKAMKGAKEAESKRPTFSTSTLFVLLLIVVRASSTLFALSQTTP
ncbi:unnamed protein product, partial [Musa banksii]